MADEAAQSLFNPSFKNEKHAHLKTYPIDGMAIIGLFGGGLPVLFFGTQSALGLRINKRLVMALVTVGVILEGVGVYTQTYWNSSVFWMLHPFGAVIGLVYQQAMRGRYMRYRMFGNKALPFLHAAIIACLLCNVVEIALGSFLKGGAIL